MEGKESENGLKGFEFRKHVKKSKWEAFQTAIYNPSSKEFLGRTGKSWGQLLVFYTIFYAVLAALFAVCFQGLLATLDSKRPTWILEQSLIGTNPGLGFRPISNKTEEGSLIWYNRKNQTSIDKWVEHIDRFLEPYVNATNSTKFQKCDFNNEPIPNKVCKVALEEFANCSRSNFYGYNSENPCIFLKLNKIYGWKPEYYENSTTDMYQYNEEFAQTVEKISNSNNHYVWVSCRGEHPFDKENLLKFEYFPQGGFPSYYFPYTNTDNYLSPLVAVRIMNLTPHVIVNIECRAWAKNIFYAGNNLKREGSVHFEILMD